MYVTFSVLHLLVIRHLFTNSAYSADGVTSFNHVVILVKLLIWHGYHTPKQPKGINVVRNKC